VGKELRSSTITLASGAKVQVDGADFGESVFVEIFADHGRLKGGQRHKVATDALKLITLGRSRPDAQLTIAFADEEAAAYATRGTWMAEALASWASQFSLSRLIRRSGMASGKPNFAKQMVNPAAPAPTDEP
jgi:hypothetical protein